MRFSAVFYLLLGIGFHALGARWLLRRFPSLRASAPRRALVWLAVAVLGGAPAFAKMALWVTDSRLVTRLLALAVLEMFAMALSVVVVAIGGGIARLVARGRRADVAPASVTAADTKVTRREAVERLAGVSVYATTTAAFGWGMVRGRHAFQTEEIVVRLPKWPRALDGYTIAQVSDIHVGAFIGERELDEGFALVRAMRPDLVVATGDLVDVAPDNVHLLARALLAVRARDGAFAIPGNHDHYAGPDEVLARLRAGGVGTLVNESVHLRGADGHGFALVGVDDLRGRGSPRPGFAGPDLRGALTGVPDDRPRILLAHQPNYFRESAGRVDLQLSGHTHGGQIRPLTSAVTAFWDFVAGRYEREGSTLYVNRGFGTSGPPSRVGSPPEITKIVLVSG